MNIIWILRSATVNDIVEKLKSGNYAYTTISTVMRQLEHKGALTTVKNGKAHIYVPELSREEFELRALDNLVKEHFAEDPSLLVRRLLGKKDLRAADLDEMKILIEDKLREMDAEGENLMGSDLT